jgi:ABC-type multidrug transport system fused ATPase/permease subunit
MNQRIPEEIYSSRIEHYKLKIHRVKRIETILSIAKLALAIGFIAVFYLAARAYSPVQLFVLIAIAVCFTAVAIIHENFIKKRNFFFSLQSINEGEISALKHEFPDYDSGEVFQDPDHAYSSDLDLFGQRSVFHYLNRTATGMGCRGLANWLKHLPADNELAQIEERQKAVWELSEKIELRQNVQAHGKIVEDSLERLDAIADLIQEPAFILPQKNLILLFHIMPLLTLGFVGLVIAGLPWPLIFLPLIASIVINRRTGKNLIRIYLMATKNTRILRNYAQIIEEIEKADYSCEMLKKIRESLHRNDKPASFYIRKLSSLVGYLELRRNPFFHPIFNTLFFWDLQWTYRLEKWKAKIAPQVPAWFEAIGRFEALSSFANLSFNHPSWSMPEISSADFALRAKNLGHLLIPDDQRIGNDLEMDGKGKIWVITGPNMSGKSTLLKTVGVNMVLALAGAPVCADSCVLSPIKLYTNLKVSDSLDKNLSLFYAELQRLKMVIDGVAEHGKVFFLVDEMLKGTNALDRQAGAIALLKQLAASETNGFVATHDLELTKLEEDYPTKITNYHFEGYIEGDKLLFDYKLKSGKCESFNALILMRKMGIDV